MHQHQGDSMKLEYFHMIVPKVTTESHVTSDSNPGCPEPNNTWFIRLFSTTRNLFFFQPINPDIVKKLELLLHWNISDSDSTEVVEWCVNAQIRVFVLSTITVRC